MQAIKSFVLFDLETTGLPSPGVITKITEVAMQAFTRANLMSANGRIPRISNKLVFCINPAKQIDPVAARITGLDNGALRSEKTFGKDLAMSMKHFLEQLPKPICLVAHNGNKFDFPLLLAELNHIGEQLPDDILCVDSLLAFQSIFPRGSGPPLQETQSNETSVNGGSSTSTVMVPTSPDIVLISSSSSEEESCLGNVGGPPAKKKLKTSPTLKNHKLDELYKFLISVRKRDNSHSAEGDVYALAMCIANQTNSFFAWADANAVKLNSIKEMWGTRLVRLLLVD